LTVLASASHVRACSLEFTVDHPDVAQIDAIWKENAHRDRARWLSGDHASNNDWRPGS